MEAIKSNRYKHYFFELLTLAVPILIGNLGHTLIGATDILVVAGYNINSLAAISIANSILFTIFIFGLGVSTAISVILSNMRGAKQKIKKYLPSSILFSIFLSIIFSIICYTTKFLVPYMGFGEELVPYIQQYIGIVSFSIIGIYLYEGIKQFLQAYEIVKFPNILLLIAVVLNLIFDIVFVFGFGFIPPMGVKGAAIATSLVRTIVGLVMLIYVIRFINIKTKPDYKYMMRIIKIGSPIGTALLLEFLAFNIITILVGRENGILSAVHNILITITSATYMVPMSISTALAVKVSYYYGAEKPLEIKRYSYTALIAGVGFMAAAGIMLAIFPEQLIKLFTKDTNVLRIAVPVVIITAIYQVFDGFQTVMGGVLKGFKMTKFVSLSVLTGYWIVGMPIAVILVGQYHMSLKGYWIALAVSLCIIGIIQAFAARYKFNKINK